MKEKTLQEKIKEVLPKEQETCTCEEDIGYHTKDCDFTPFGYNACLSDVHSSIPKVMEVIREEIKKVTADPFKDSDDVIDGFMICKAKLLDLLK